MTTTLPTLVVRPSEQKLGEICPMCGQAVPHEVSLVRINGAPCKVIETEYIGSRLIPGTSKWMRRVPIVKVQE